MRGTFNHSAGADYMPEAWVRGAMLIRCKSLLAGHSAVRFEIIELLIALLNANMYVPSDPALSYYSQCHSLSAFETHYR